jgi:hypothetical protein
LILRSALYILQVTHTTTISQPSTIGRLYNYSIQSNTVLLYISAGVTPATTYIGQVSIQIQFLPVAIVIITPPLLLIYLRHISTCPISILRLYIILYISAPVQFKINTALNLIYIFDNIYFDIYLQNISA